MGLSRAESTQRLWPTYIANGCFRGARRDGDDVLITDLIAFKKVTYYTTRCERDLTALKKRPLLTSQVGVSTETRDG